MSLNKTDIEWCVNSDGDNIPEVILETLYTGKKAHDLIHDLEFIYSDFSDSIVTDFREFNAIQLEGEVIILVPKEINPKHKSVCTVCGFDFDEMTSDLFPEAKSDTPICCSCLSHRDEA